MYKKAIDILMNADTDLKAIAISIAKSNPSIFVKAADKVAGNFLDSLSPREYFEKEHGENPNFKCRMSQMTYERFVEKYGKEPWFLQTMEHLFVNNQKIKAIKVVREHTKCGLKEAKFFVEDLVDGRAVDVPTIWS